MPSEVMFRLAKPSARQDMQYIRQDMQMLLGCVEQNSVNTGRHMHVTLLDMEDLRFSDIISLHIQHTG